MMNTTHAANGWVRNVGPQQAGYHRADNPRLQWGWWRANRDYIVYMLREASSVFIALWSLRFLLQLGRLRRGRESYDRFVAGQRSPFWLAFNLITLAFAVLHAVTWFQLTGVVMSGLAQKVRLGRFRLSGPMITAGSFAAWAAASIMILVGLLLGGRKE